MDSFFGVGIPEILLVLVLALIVMGPRDMVSTSRNIGRFIYRITRSETWRTIRETSAEIRKLPTEIIREAGVEEALREVKDTVRETGQVINSDLAQAVSDMQTASVETGSELNAALSDTDTAPPPGEAGSAAGESAPQVYGDYPMSGAGDPTAALQPAETAALPLTAPVRRPRRKAAVPPAAPAEPPVENDTAPANLPAAEAAPTASPHSSAPRRPRQKAAVPPTAPAEPPVETTLAPEKSLPVIETVPAAPPRTAPVRRPRLKVSVTAKPALPAGDTIAAPANPLPAPETGTSGTTSGRKPRRPRLSEPPTPLPDIPDHGDPGGSSV